VAAIMAGAGDTKFGRRFRPVPKQTSAEQERRRQQRRQRKTKRSEANIFIDGSGEVERLLADLDRKADKQSLRERILAQTGAYLEMARSCNGSGPGSVASFAGDRSVGELSIHDQLVLLNEGPPDGQEDEASRRYRTGLWAEIRAMTASDGAELGELVGLTRSLSESDLSELCGGECPSPEELLRAFTPPNGDSKKQRSESGSSANTVGRAPVPLPKHEDAAGRKPALPPKSKRLHRDGGKIEVSFD